MHNTSEGREYELGDRDRAEIDVMHRYLGKPETEWPSLAAFGRLCSQRLREIRAQATPA